MNFIPDVNNRIVYTMRTLGHGYAGIQKFTNLMNMPKPMTGKNYNRTANKIRDVVQEVAKDTMKDAIKELHEIAKSDGKEVIDVGVSYDGTCYLHGQWKVVDVEALNKHCKACSI